MSEDSARRKMVSSAKHTAGSDSTASDFQAPDSLVDRLADMLRNEIILGKIKQGEKITEVRLAQRLGISRNPIREAVRRLEGTGLLVNHPRRGRFVREISREEADDIFYFRTMIERSVIMRLAETRTSKDIKTLRGILDRMYETGQQGDVASTFEIDVHFHRTICEMAGSRRALRAFEDIHAELRILLRMVGTTYSTLDEAVSNHEPLLDAIAAGDVKAADQAMADHIKRTHVEVAKHFDAMNK